MTAAGETGTAAGARDGPPAGLAGAAGAKKQRLAPHAYFLVSAVFHYLGPALAVLLFAQIAPLGVAWLRIASAAVVFLLWRRPARLWRLLRGGPARDPAAGRPLRGCGCGGERRAPPAVAP